MKLIVKELKGVGWLHWPVQLQKQARSLNFQTLKDVIVLSVYNKGADKLTAPLTLRFCFRICKSPVFSGNGSFYSN